MKKIFILILLINIIYSCKPDFKPKKTNHLLFDTFCKEIVLQLWKDHPQWASSVGFHNYDSLLPLPDYSVRNYELLMADSLLNSLERFDYVKLNNSQKTDYSLLKNYAEYTKFNILELQPHRWDPSYYNIGGALESALTHNHFSLEIKLRNVAHLMEKSILYYEYAANNLKEVSKLHTELAIAQNEGLYYILDNMISDSIKFSKLTDSEKTTLIQKKDLSKRAINQYIVFLKNVKLKEIASGIFANPQIGKDLYTKKFNLEIQSHISAEEIYKKALDTKQTLINKMYHVSTELWLTYFPNFEIPLDTTTRIKKIIEKLSLNHCHKDSFIQTIRYQIPDLISFINSKNIIDLDSSKPLEIRETPAWMAGVAGASISSPGPYDKNSATFYNVTPLVNYSTEEAEDYLKEYNNYILQILNIHEAIPGHYTQLIYANRSPSLIKSILGNGAMIEGWACYVERMMIEEGYNNCPEMKLFYYKWNLRECTNMILDYSVHCLGMSEIEALNLLVTGAFQQNAEAKEKYKRALLTQVQLSSYFSGLTDIYELREEVKTRNRNSFNLKEFHEQFLSYGNAPVKEIRKLMLKEN